MLKYKIVPVTPYEQNCSLVWCDQTQRAAVVDPGGDVPKILAQANQLDLTVEQIWITHGHWDHAAAAAELAKQLSIPIYGPHQDDLFWIDLIATQIRGTPGFENAQSFVPDCWLNDGDQVEIGEEKLEVLHCPGHTPGHVVFYSQEKKLAFVGDVLFAGSIGRTDFPMGNYDQLINSIVTKLWPLGDDVVFVPGHGPEGTLGHERRTNPFVQGT